MPQRPDGPVPILLTVRELNLGGIERDAAKLAIHLDRTRFIPHVASHFPHGLRYEELKQQGVPVLDLAVRSFKSPSILSSAYRLWAYLRKHRIRVVHSMDVSAVFVTPIARAAGVPVVLSSMLGSRFLLPRQSHKQLKWTDRIVDAVVVNCEAMRQHMIEEGVTRDRIELCYNGVDTTEFYPAETPRPAPVAGASLVIGAICALRPEKALHLLQEAFARVRHIDPQMRLLIVGSGAELPRLQANAERLQLGESCVFQPATREVASFLRAIDIFVLCSVSEAFSNALLEAMACGCAAVGSRVGGTPELLGASSERGLLFESENVAGLAAQLEKLIRNPEMRREYGRRASAWAHSNLSVEANAARSAEIYEMMLRRKTSGAN